MQWPELERVRHVSRRGVSLRGASWCAGRFVFFMKTFFAVARRGI